MIEAITRGFLRASSYPSTVQKPKDMQAACKALEAHSSAPRAARIQVPRVIAAIYELRNNRAIGHAGGDIKPNYMDGLLFDRSIKWIICELIRIYSNLTMDETTALIENVSVKWTPAVWESGDQKRVVLDGTHATDKILILLHHSDGTAKISEIKNWIGINNITHLRERYVKPLHRENYINFQANTGIITILPKGINRIESVLLPHQLGA